MKVHLITNCTSSKSSKIKSSVNVKEIINSNKSASTEWSKKLKKQSDTVKAINLYVGDHWSKVTEIYNLNHAVWVVSAGYGLISADHDVTTYNATFNSNDENSVSQFVSEGSLADKNIIWWNSINKNNLLIPNSVGPMEKLYEDNPSDVFFIAVPPTYLKVLEPELSLLATKGVIHKDNTFIFSSKQSIKPSLDNLFYQAKDDLCSYLGGSRISLNIRLTSYIIKKISLTKNISAQVKTLYHDVLNNAPPAERFSRQKMTDEDISNFINQEIKHKNINDMSATKLLRTLRNNGQACEQKRFGKLYKLVLRQQLEQNSIGNS